MKKILVLSMVVVLAFSGFAFAGEVGHLDPEKFSATPVVVIVGAAGEVDLEGLVDFDDSHPISENFALVGLSSLQSLIDNLNAHFHNKQSSIGTIEDASAAKFCVLRINTVTTEEQTLVFKIDGTAINNAFNTESVEVGQNLHLVLLNSDGTTFSDFTLNVSVNYREFSIVDEDGNPVSRIEKDRGKMCHIAAQGKKIARKVEGMKARMALLFTSQYIQNPSIPWRLDTDESLPSVHTDGNPAGTETIHQKILKKSPAVRVAGR